MLGNNGLKAIICLAVVFAIAALAGVISLGVVYQKKLTPFRDYSVVIDAGSTHSTIYVYTWPADKSDGLGNTSRVSQAKACPVAGDAVTDIPDPSIDGVRKYFDADMTDCLSGIPSTRKRRALIFLAGTAGLRLYNEQNPNKTQLLLTSIRNYFNTLGLLFRAPEYQVRIINGSEEGLSGWTTSNMLLSLFINKTKPENTYGVSDLGGASTQLTFYSPNAVNNRYTMHLFEQDYDLYSHSYLCYGIEQVRRTYLSYLIRQSNGSLEVEDPCLQAGFAQNRTYDDIFGTPCTQKSSISLPEYDPSSIFTLIGIGNATACANAMKDRFNKTVCTSGSCSFDGIYQPEPISSSLQFVGISNGWFATFDSLASYLPIQKNIDGNYDFTNITLQQIQNGIATVCDQPWNQVPTPDKYRSALCFNAMYQWTLYSYGYSMTDANLKNFHVVRRINATDIGWTLGYMINQTNSLDAEYRPERLLTKSEFTGLLIFCIVVLVVSIIVVAVVYHFFRNRRSFDEK